MPQPETPSEPKSAQPSEARRLAREYVDRMPEQELAAVNAFLRFTLDRVAKPAG